MELTFDQLPSAVSRLYAKLEDIERLIQNKDDSREPSDEWFDLNELCGYLPDKPAKPTAYNWVHNSDIPHHKRGKKLYFLKSEIDAWLKTGRKKTVSEIEAEADAYLSNSKRKAIS